MKRVFQIFAFSFCLIVTGAASGMAAPLEIANEWQKQDKPPERPKEKPKDEKPPERPKDDKKKPER